jgi:hypothetical protein
MPGWAPASAKRSPTARPTSGVTSDGFSTTVLPARSAEMTGVIARVSG